MSNNSLPVAGARASGGQDVPLPDGMFFLALDYDPFGRGKAEARVTQRKVVPHRQRLKSDIRQLISDLLSINEAAHAADRQGNLPAHWDSAITAAEKVLESVKKLGKAIDASEERFIGALLDETGSIEASEGHTEGSPVVEMTLPADSGSTKLHVVADTTVPLPSMLLLNGSFRRKS